jgi:hypothetical protein
VLPGAGFVHEGIAGATAAEPTERFTVCFVGRLPGLLQSLGAQRDVVRDFFVDIAFAPDSAAEGKGDPASVARSHSSVLGQRAGEHGGHGLS